MSPLISHGGHTESHSIFATYVRNDLMCPSRHRDTKSSLAKVTRNTVIVAELSLPSFRFSVLVSRGSGKV